MKHRLLSLALALALALSLALPAAAETGEGAAAASGPRSAAVEVTVNGAYVRWTDARPFIDENNRTMVPLRAVAEALGLSVGWDAAAREASFTDGSRAICFPIGSTDARADGGGVIPMDTAAVIVNDRTYAPVRYLAEFFGFTVGWDGAARTVLITGSLRPVWVGGGDSFAARGVDAGVDDHGTKAYRTVTELGTPVTCHAGVGRYRIFREDDDFPGRDGYEWRVMRIEITAPADRDLDWYQCFISSDWYDIRQHADSRSIDGDGVEHFTVSLDGRKISYSLRYQVVLETEKTLYLIVAAQVPAGYDGLVVGLMNYALRGVAAEDYLYEYFSDPADFALFRMY